MFIALTGVRDHGVNCVLDLFKPRNFQLENFEQIESKSIAATRPKTKDKHYLIGYLIGFIQ